MVRSTVSKSSKGIFYQPDYFSPITGTVRLCSDCEPFVLTSFINHGTGTALPDDNGRTLVTTAPRLRAVGDGWPHYFEDQLKQSIYLAARLF